MAETTVKAYSTIGTVLEVSANGTTWEKMCPVKSFPALGGAPEQIEVTDLEDEQQAFVPGVQAMDAMEFGANYTLENYNGRTVLFHKEGRISLSEEDFSMNVKINNKNYVVPQLGFKHMTQMEDMGFSILDLFQKKKVFSMATAFVGVVAECDREKAEYLIEQHVLGGGNIEDIYKAFSEAVEQSGFFKKLLNQEENTMEK